MRAAYICSKPCLFFIRPHRSPPGTGDCGAAFEHILQGGKMHIRLDHLTINVRDMEASERFYGEVLGLPKMENVDMGDHEIHYFQLDGPVRLELISYMDDFGELKANVKTRGI